MLPADLAYVGNVNVNLICCICCNPFLNPTATTKCTHTFCKGCITSALSFNGECPVDRTALSLADLVPASTIVRNLVDELPVKCPNYPYGCTHTCQRQLLQNHLTSECLHSSTQCCEAGCEAILLRRDADKHANDCPHRIVMCEACSASIKFKDLEYHETQCPAADWVCSFCDTVVPRSDHKAHLEECPEVQIPCPQLTNGCPWTGARHTLPAHTSSSCPYERIKGFFAINNSRLSSLETENASLRQQVERLESHMAAVRRDVENARTSLGPWFRRPNDPLVSTPQPRQEQQRVTRRRLSVPLTTASFPRDSSEESDAADEQHAQDYFGLMSASGSGTGTDYARVETTTTSHVTSPMSPSLSEQSVHGINTPYFHLPLPLSEDPSARAYTSTTQSQSQSQSHQSRIAPIDLSTSLENCLNSLRLSIVTLSCGLDSLERRQDLALTTETLRMHEDVASLRAIVHGLRMQVHTIMMDRNGLASGRSGTGGGTGGGEGSGPHTTHAHAYGGAHGESTTSALVESGVGGMSRPYYPPSYPPVQISLSQMTSTSMRRTSGLGDNNNLNKL